MMKSLGVLKATSSSNSWSILIGKFRQLSTEGIKVKAHIPLIRFRKGGDNSRLSSTTNVNTNQPSIKGSGLDESSTPIKYRRKTLSDLEIQIIEQGGCY